jgi:hypothetical protein
MLNIIWSRQYLKDLPGNVERDIVSKIQQQQFNPIMREMLIMFILGIQHPSIFHLSDLFLSHKFGSFLQLFNLRMLHDMKTAGRFTFSSITGEIRFLFSRKSDLYEKILTIIQECQHAPRNVESEQLLFLKNCLSCQSEHVAWKEEKRPLWTFCNEHCHSNFYDEMKSDMGNA